MQDNAQQPFFGYQVQPGDTLRSVADRFGVSVASLASASGLLEPDLLRVGEVLTIPRERGWLYRVQAGESLASIATRTGVPEDMLRRLSRLTGSEVQAGDVLLVPEAGSAMLAFK